MTRIEKNINITAPIDEVFAFASDYKKWGIWFEGVSEFRPTTNLINGNGARYAYKAKMMGLSVDVETELFDFVEHEGWKGRAIKGMPHTTFWIFESTNDGTRFTYALEYELKIPLLGRILDSAIMQPQWNRIISKSLENLRNQFNHPVN